MKTLKAMSRTTMQKTIVLSNSAFPRITFYNNSSQISTFMNIYVTNVDTVSKHVTYKPNENRTSKDALKAFPQTLTCTNQLEEEILIFLFTQKEHKMEFVKKSFA